MREDILIKFQEFIEHDPKMKGHKIIHEFRQELQIIKEENEKLISDNIQLLQERKEMALKNDALKTENEKLKGEVGALEAWQKVAAESNISIDAYCRELFPDLPEHYGMPLDGIKKAIKYTIEKLKSENIKDVFNEARRVRAGGFISSKLDWKYPTSQEYLKAVEK